MKFPLASVLFTSIQSEDVTCPEGLLETQGFTTIRDIDTQRKEVVFNTMITEVEVRVPYSEEHTPEKGYFYLFDLDTGEYVRCVPDPAYLHHAEADGITKEAVEAAPNTGEMTELTATEPAPEPVKPKVARKPARGQGCMNQRKDGW